MIVNLAHVLRKKRHYREAEQHYLTALSFAPGEAGTLAALAFTCLLQVRPLQTSYQSFPINWRPTCASAARRTDARTCARRLAGRCTEP